MREIVFAVPGDLATPTGGYVYDLRIIAELRALGWQVEVLDLGDGFPRATAELCANATSKLAAVHRGRPLVIDGLAFGVLAQAAEQIRHSHCAIALVHHPLALETGLNTGEMASLRESERGALRCARHVIATSTPTAQILAQEFDVPLERMTVVEPGTDVGSKVRRHGEATVVLLSVGAVVLRKGYDVLVDALAEIAHLPWRLVIAGDCARDPATAWALQAQILRLGLGERIELLGALSAEQVSGLYAACDVFVLPSRFEGYGMAFTEALAHGVPVVGTTVGAAMHTVPEHAGLLVPVDDAAALASALRRLIEDPGERARLAAGARALTFPSWREQGERFARVLENLT